VLGWLLNGKTFVFVIRLSKNYITMWI